MALRQQPLFPRVVARFEMLFSLRFQQLFFASFVAIKDATIKNTEDAQKRKGSRKVSQSATRSRLVSYDGGVLGHYRSRGSPYTKMRYWGVGCFEF